MKLCCQTWCLSNCQKPQICVPSWTQTSRHSRCNNSSVLLSSVQRAQMLAPLCGLCSSSAAPRDVPLASNLRDSAGSQTESRVKRGRSRRHLSFGNVFKGNPSPNQTEALQDTFGSSPPPTDLLCSSHPAVVELTPLSYWSAA